MSPVDITTGKQFDVIPWTDLRRMPAPGIRFGIVGAVQGFQPARKDAGVTGRNVHENESGHFIVQRVPESSLIDLSGAFGLQWPDRQAGGTDQEKSIQGSVDIHMGFLRVRAQECGRDRIRFESELGVHIVPHEMSHATRFQIPDAGHIHTGESPERKSPRKQPSGTSFAGSVSGRADRHERHPFRDKALVDHEIPVSRAVSENQEITRFDRVALGL